MGGVNQGRGVGEGNKARTTVATYGFLVMVKVKVVNRPVYKQDELLEVGSVVSLPLAVPVELVQGLHAHVTVEKWN